METVNIVSSMRFSVPCSSPNLTLSFIMRMCAGGAAEGNGGAAETGG